jgi:hypothetical protein
MSLLPVLAATVMLTACTTLENRRDLYFPQKVNGPYTRMLSEKPKKEKKTRVVVKTVTVPVSSRSDGKSVVR